jgi:hypothetical protein
MHDTGWKSFSRSAVVLEIVVTNLQGWVKITVHLTGAA